MSDRVAGATTEVTALREALNKGQTSIDPMSDIHAVCAVVKYWFRNLPETVIPEKFFDSIIEAASECHSHILHLRPLTES